MKEDRKQSLQVAEASVRGPGRELTIPQLILLTNSCLRMCFVHPLTIYIYFFMWMLPFYLFQWSEMHLCNMAYPSFQQFV